MHSTLLSAIDDKDVGLLKKDEILKTTINYQQQKSSSLCYSFYKKK